MVDSKGDITVLNEPFHIGDEYTGEYTFATIDIGKKALIIRYTNENMKVTKINQFHYKFD